MTKLTNFIETIKTNGVAKPSHFVVEFSRPAFFFSESNVSTDTLTMVKLFCEGAAFPEMALATSTIKDYGVNREVVYDKMYGQLPLTFICDQGMYIRQFFDAWIQAIAPYRGGLFEYPAMYTAPSLTVYQLDAAKNKVYSVTFHNIYPKVLNDMQLNASSKDYHRFQVLFTYEHWESNVGMLSEPVSEAMIAAKSRFNVYRDNILLPTREVSKNPIDIAFELLEESTQFIDDIRNLPGQIGGVVGDVVGDVLGTKVGGIVGGVVGGVLGTQVDLAVGTVVNKVNQTGNAIVAEVNNIFS